MRAPIPFDAIARHAPTNEYNTSKAGRTDE
jgi:hypothetical protein